MLSASPRRGRAQAAANAEGRQIAVATRQKSTARRLVSMCAVLEDTHQMLFTSGSAVTSHLRDAALAEDAADRCQQV